MESNDKFFDIHQEEEIMHDVVTTIYELNYGKSAPTRLPRDSWFGLTRRDQNAWKIGWNVIQHEKSPCVFH